MGQSDKKTAIREVPFSVEEGSVIIDEGDTGRAFIPCFQRLSPRGCNGRKVPDAWSRCQSMARISSSEHIFSLSLVQPLR